MGQWFSLLFSLLLVLTGSLQFGQGMASLAEMAGQLRSLWELEYSYRLCGEELASQRNLAYGAAMILSVYPTWRDEIQAAYEAAEAESKARFDGIWQALPRAWRGRRSPETCLAAFRDRFRIKVYQQINPAVARLTPNWVVGFSDDGS